MTSINESETIRNCPTTTEPDTNRGLWILRHASATSFLAVPVDSYLPTETY